MAEERKYVLTRLGHGDYALPGNDGRSLFRITRVASPSDTWDLYRYVGDLNRLDTDEWANWECVAQCEPTRQSAIDEAVRLSTVRR